VKQDRFRVEFLWERYCRCADEFAHDRYEQQLLDQLRAQVRMDEESQSQSR
jgi:hypothetical protein